MAHQAGTYSGFFCIKRQGVFILLPGWDARVTEGLPPAFNSPERGNVGVKCLAQEHNTVPSARARTKHTNRSELFYCIFYLL